MKSTLIGCTLNEIDAIQVECGAIRPGPRHSSGRDWLGDEPPRIGGVRKMRVFKTGWQILMLLIREYIRSKRFPASVRAS